MKQRPCTRIATTLLAAALTVISAPAQSPTHTASTAPATPAVPAWSSPVDPPIIFSGNFGEIRSNHFHGGLDFKTGGAVGRPVYAVADGYISRIRVTHGSGYVLDVTYGAYTTINRHLSAFAGPIADRVEALQYSTESWEVDIKPAPDEYPVSRGQRIALGGNTGYSFGPHLHFDVIEDSTGYTVDPLPFFKRLVKDTTPPRAVGIRLYPQPGRGVADEKSMTAWGEVGIGIRAYDYMEGANNRYGVHTVVLLMDSVEVFRSDMSRYDPDRTRQINSWADGTYMKSFIDPGCTLDIAHALNSRRGLITLDEERPYLLTYRLTDALGNISVYRYTLHGRRTAIPADTTPPRHLFRWNRANILQEPGLDLIVPRGNLYDDLRLDFAMRIDSTRPAHIYQLTSRTVNLNGRARLSIRLRRPAAGVDTIKYYLMAFDSKGKPYSLGGRYSEGAVTGEVRQLGTVTVGIDTIPPVLTPRNPQAWARNGRVVYELKDEQTGIRTYCGTIDGEYALFGIPNSTNDRLEYRIDRTRLRPGRHIIKVTATDERGNTVTRTDTLTLR
ncbi:MAG: M23 family metallopeptidase [Prevotellaceae bacterium]|jgi:hypothetical protein|nr:M23 family metallopeptidase [Prevotellaceae bacterium]